jgi:hypothetical protein
MPKHDWNSLQGYLEVHEKILRQYQRYMEVHRNYKYEVITELWHSLECSQIIFKPTKEHVSELIFTKTSRWIPRIGGVSKVMEIF